MEVDSATNTYGRVKCGRVRRTNKGGSKATRLQYSLDAKVVPCMREIWKWDPPFFMLGVWMTFVNEAIGVVNFTKVTFVILALMFIGDLSFQL